MTDDPAPGGAPASDRVPDPPVAEWRRVGRGPQRRTRWDRPPHPKDWRWLVGWIGRALIIMGLTMFLFVAYQLWGTGIEQARAQERLENEFARLREQVADQPAPPTAAPATTFAATMPGSEPPTSAPATPPTAAPTTTPSTTVPEVLPVDAQNLPVPEPGDPMAYIAIPKIGVGEYVVSGVTRNDLKKGPGHFRDTPFPGQLGNAAIAGHRTTYGAPFGNINELEPGDDIEIQLTNGYQYVYIVTGRVIVSPSDYEVISNSDPTKSTLTLVTCDPPTTSADRLIVFADLDPSRSGPVGEPLITGEPEVAELDVPATTAPTTTPTTSPGAGTAAAPSQPGTPVDTTGPSTTAAAVGAGDDDASAAPEASDAFSEGWFADTAAWPQIVLWGLALALIVTGGWWLARLWRREWVGVLAACVPFLVCLYFFFQNANRLLPPGL